MKCNGITNSPYSTACGNRLADNDKDDIDYAFSLHKKEGIDNEASNAFYIPYCPKKAALIKHIILHK